VTLHVDLSDLVFEIAAGVKVAPKIEIEIIPYQGCYFLDDLAATRNQGSVIRVCVKPDADSVSAGIKMRSLDDFTFTKVSLSSRLTSVFSQPAIRQPATTGYNQEANNGSTSLACSNAADVCVFETILFAAGSMHFGALGIRTLQAGSSESVGTSEFALDVEVNERPPEPYFLLQVYIRNAANRTIISCWMLWQMQPPRGTRDPPFACVKPDAEAVTHGIKMHDIEWFTFTRDAIIISQPSSATI
jgi:hypothetical protein